MGRNGEYEMRNLLMGCAAIYNDTIEKIHRSEPYILDASHDGWFRKVRGIAQGYGLMIRSIKLIKAKPKDWAKGFIYPVSLKYEDFSGDGKVHSGRAYLYVDNSKTPEEIIAYIENTMASWVC